MAVINKDTKLRIAKKLCEKTYGKTLTECNARLSKMIEEESLKVIPKSIIKEAENYPLYFTFKKEVSISFEDIKAWIKPEINMYIYTYFCFKFSKKIPFPVNGMGYKDVISHVIKFGSENLKSMIIDYVKLIKENDEMLKKLNCLFENTSFTDKKLKEEFPEAYSIYCEIKDIPKEVATSTSCDSIENIRATLNKK